MASRIAMKPEVRLSHRNLLPHMMRALEVARDVAPSLRDDTVMVTSANDSVHSYGSLHYRGEAWDIRTTGGGPNAPGQIISGEADVWAAAIRKGLGQGWDVVDEGDHIHIEYDPA